MEKYIIVTTLCNKKEIADKIISTLLNKKLVAGSHLSEVKSKYWWNDKLEEETEFKIEFRTRESLFNQIEYEIKSIHDYDVAEISYIEINGANKEFLEWIDRNTKMEGVN